MESVYAALLLHKAQKNITQTNLKKVLDAAGVEVDVEQLKKLVAGLKQTNIDELIKNASAMPVAVAAAPTAPAEESPKEKKKPKKEEKEEEEDEEPVGIGSLF